MPGSGGDRLSQLPAGELGELLKSRNVCPGGLFLGSQEARYFGFTDRAKALDHPAAVKGFLDFTGLDLNFLATLDTVSFEIHCNSPLHRQFAFYILRTGPLMVDSSEVFIRLRLNPP
jgi:hypothetical protein